MKANDPGILPESICFSFTPSEQARQLFFYPTWCGHYYCTKNYFIRRESFPSILIVFIREGIFHFEYRDLIFDAEKGDVVLLDCSEPHYYQAHDGLEFLYINFDGSNAHDICQFVLDKNGPLLRHSGNVLIGRQLFDMVDFYLHDGIETMMQSSARIYRLLECLMLPDSQFLEQDNPVETAIRYIRQNIGKDISLNELANQVSLSPYYFAHRFKAETGFSPLEYVINTRLEQIKILLVSTSRSITDIAYEAGYSSLSSLNNMFVKRTGMSPRQFRQTYQGISSTK